MEGCIKTESLLFFFNFQPCHLLRFKDSFFLTHIDK